MYFALIADPSGFASCCHSPSNIMLITMDQMSKLVLYVGKYTPVSDLWNYLYRLFANCIIDGASIEE